MVCEHSTNLLAAGPPRLRPRNLPAFHQSIMTSEGPASRIEFTRLIRYDTII